jgi:hypothetical protein
MGSVSKPRLLAVAGVVAASLLLGTPVLAAQPKPPLNTFNPHANIQDGGSGITVTGLVWCGPPEVLITLTVTVTQSGVTGTGQWHGGCVMTRGDPFSVSVPAPPGSEFVPGAASARAVKRVHETQGARGNFKRKFSGQLNLTD